MVCSLVLVSRFSHTDRASLPTLPFLNDLHRRHSYLEPKSTVSLVDVSSTMGVPDPDLQAVFGGGLSSADLDTGPAIQSSLVRSLDHSIFPADLDRYYVEICIEYLPKGAAENNGLSVEVGVDLSKNTGRQNNARNQGNTGVYI